MKKFLISCLCCLLALPVWANQLKSLRVAPTEEKTRVVFDLSSAPAYRYSLTGNRLTIEIDSVTTSLANLERQGAKLGPVIKSIHRQNPATDPTLQLVFELNGSVKPQMFTLRPQQRYGHRLVLDFLHRDLTTASALSSSPQSTNKDRTVVSTPTRSASASAQPARSSANSAVGTSGKPTAGRVIPMSEFSPNPSTGRIKPGEVSIKEETISSQVRTVSPTPSVKQERPAPVVRPTPASTAVERASNGVVVIAVDAGHGGKDPGAIGPRGTHEKTVTLAVARELAELINRQPGMRAVMTRTGDYFVDLDARSEIARRQKAQLLISIHADSVDNATARGASVWILSNKRVDREMNKLLEQQDKHTQLLGGAGKVIAEAEPNPYLAQTILDLSWDNSRSEGYNIGEEVLNQIGRVARLHKSKPVHASLAVLKAPDIPSLLIETGFISNHFEEKQLSSHAYQRQIATAIFRGVRGYYAENAPEGSVRVASRQTAAKSVSENRGEAIRHVVSSGESLSGLAQRYGVSKRRLRDHNSLKSENLLIGQVLYIPAS
ncbi:N-acetylmuramoyl-L-alanine amidase [Pseudaeromonas pectinilytica]